MISLVADNSPKEVVPGFGSRLRECRKRLGMNQDQLGACFGSLKPYVSNVELGRGNFGLVKLAELASALPALDISYLLTGRKGLLFELSENFTPEDLEMLSRLSTESADLLMAMVRQTLLDQSVRSKRKRASAK